MHRDSVHRSAPVSRGVLSHLSEPFSFFNDASTFGKMTLGLIGRELKLSLLPWSVLNVHRLGRNWRRLGGSGGHCSRHLWAVYEQNAPFWWKGNMPVNDFHDRYLHGGRSLCRFG